MTGIQKISLRILTSLFFLFPLSSYSYLTTLESGEVLPLSDKRFELIPQIITSDSSGLNVDVAYNTAWKEDMSSRFQVGSGKMDIHLGGSFKWIPFPDVKQQPAIGVRGSLWYARYKDENYMTFSGAPLVSKKVEQEVGLFVPYVSIPINYTLNRQRNYFSQQFVIGTEFFSPRAKDWSWSGELGLNLKDSYSYIAFLVGYQFDGSKGLPFR